MLPCRTSSVVGDVGELQPAHPTTRPIFSSSIPRLLATRGAVSASILVGVIHAVWHWPLIVLPHQYLSGVPLVAFSVFVVSEALLFTWLSQNTGGSVLLATLLHGSSNGAMLFYDGIAPELAPWLKASISALTATILVLTSGPTLGRGRITKG